MTRHSIIKYAEAIRGRYFRASKKGKTAILNEFVATTGMHRKAAILLLNRRGRPPGKKRSGRPRLYGLEAMAALKVAWEASDRLCSKRFQPFLPELVNVLKRQGELSITQEVEVELLRMSASTTDRVLRRYRARPRRHGLSTTKPSTVLKKRFL